jgi:hypothetical protein
VRGYAEDDERRDATEVLHTEFVRDREGEQISIEAQVWANELTSFTRQVFVFPETQQRLRE